MRSGVLGRLSDSGFDTRRFTRADMAEGERVTGRTSIEWTAQPGYEPAVWNPSVGCTRVSAGCDACYAFALHDKRHVAT